MTDPRQLRGAPADGRPVGTLARVAARTGGRVVAGEAGAVVRGVAADTRAVCPGDLFCALRGARVDAHTLVAAAFAAGAAGALVDRAPGDRWTRDAVPAGAGVVLVPDVVAALGRLAAAHLGDLRPGPVVVGVTGSVGKTTTRGLIAAALGAEGAAVLVPDESFNTEVSVPLVCLRAAPAHRFAVLELAMRGPGQIAHLCGVCRPRVGVLTVIGESHLESLGSVEAIAAAKGELLEALPRDGWAICNADDPRQEPLAARSIAPVRTFGLDREAGVRATSLAPLPGGAGWAFVARLRASGRSVAVRLPLLGRHHVRNALAALACAEALGVDPAAAAAALEALADAAPPGARAAVLGDMLELGPVTVEAHRAIGRAAAGSGLVWLVTVGEFARHLAEGARQAGMPAERVHEAADRAGAEAALAGLLGQAPPGSVVLFKASHAVGLDRVAEWATRTLQASP